jgi:hypothetical protein
MELTKTFEQRRDDMLLALVGDEPTAPILQLSQAEQRVLVSALRICERAYELTEDEDYHSAELALRSAIDYWQ